MPILDNPKHEMFAQQVATGKPACEAYRIVYDATEETANANACRLTKDEDIKERITELQAASAKRAVLTLAEKRQFLRDVVKTPIGVVDEQSELVQSAEYEIQAGRGDKEGRTLLKIKMPDKLRALELDAKLAGELKEKVEVGASDGLSILLTALREGK